MIINLSPKSLSKMKIEDDRFTFPVDKIYFSYSTFSNDDSVDTSKQIVKKKDIPSIYKYRVSYIGYFRENKIVTNRMSDLNDSSADKDVEYTLDF